MPARFRIGTPGRLVALFVALTALPLALLGWLGHRLLDQEATLERQQLERRLEQAAELATTEVDRTIGSWERAASQALESRDEVVPAGTALLVFDSQRVLRAGGLTLPFHPTLFHPADGRSTKLVAAQTAELGQDFSGAVHLYRSIITSTDAVERAPALLGLARCLRAQRRLQDALAVYDQLATMGSTPVFGFPAALLAHERRYAVLGELGDRAAADQERVRWSAAVLTGDYRPDRAAFDTFVTTLQLEPPLTPALAIAETVADHWQAWRQQRQGRQVLRHGDHDVFFAWRSDTTRLSIVAGVARMVTDSLAPTFDALRVAMTLEDPAGDAASDRPPVRIPVTATRSLKAAGLTWNVKLSSLDTPPASGWWSRQRLFIGGFVLLVFVISGASYAVFRSVNRELAVARLQSDFVSAVSHEFRSPLTAISHLAEVLEDGQAADDQKPRYYRGIAREARRLKKLVEGLLDFARLEADRHEYEMQPLDPVVVASGVVDEFQADSEPSRQGAQVSLCKPDVAPSITGDPGALAMALRNLVENAVKYSVAPAVVTVSVRARSGEVDIAVADRGVGIPVAEQRRVFQTFVRGSSSRDLAVKGTGVGLAMTKRIVEAHGGRVEVESHTGQGSVFTIVLPNRIHA